jgi:MSHA biogenesis protein MshQ
MLNVYPYNATSSVTQNYTGTFNRLLASQFTLTAPTTDALKKGVDNINLVKLSATLAPPTLTDYGSGNLTFKLGSDVFTYQRENNALIAPFSNAVAVTVSSVADSDGVTASTLPMVLQPSGENIYYGRLNLINANGSELLDLPMPLTAEYWNGNSWVNNVADQCSTGITVTAAQVTGPIARLCAWDTGVGNGSSSLGCSVAGASVNKFSQPPLATNGGNFNLNFKAPGIGNTGSMDITAIVPSYLNFNWKGVGNTNPTARATFGIYKGNSHIIYIREVY